MGRGCLEAMTEGGGGVFLLLLFSRCKTWGWCVFFLFLLSMVEPHRDLWEEKYECFIHEQDEANVLYSY